MRTKTSWFKTFFIREIEIFPPRLKDDLLRIPVPEIEEVESTFIYGGVNTGKTVRAAFIAMQEAQNNYMENVKTEIVFIAFPELFLKIKETFNSKTKSENEVINKYLNCDFLVLDDFFSIRGTGWVVDVIYHLINYRYEYKLKTVITSNYSLDELEELLGDQRITSRINRFCKIEHKLKY